MKTVRIVGTQDVEVAICKSNLIESAIKVARSQAGIRPGVFVRDGELVIDNGRHCGGEGILPFDAWKVRVLEACNVLIQIRKEIIKE